MINWIKGLFKHKHEWSYWHEDNNKSFAKVWIQHEIPESWTHRKCFKCGHIKTRVGYESDKWGEEALNAIKKLESSKRPSGSTPMYWDGEKVVEEIPTEREKYHNKTLSPNIMNINRISVEEDGIQEVIKRDYLRGFN